MDLTRGGGPGDRPPIDPALEQQRELTQQREQELIKPALMAELEQHLNQRPDLQQHLSQYQPEEQDVLKQAIVDSAARFAPSETLIQRDLIEDRIRLQIAEEARQSLDPLDGATAQRGPSPGRAPTQGIILIPQGNDGVRAILNLAADPYGLNEAIIGVHSAVAHLNAIEAENRIESLRQIMTQKGIKDLPQGFQMGLDRQGRSYRDYGRTIEQLQQRYLAHSEDMRLTSTWGADYRTLRIGKSGMTVQQFEDRVIRIQQQAVDGAYERGLDRMAKGWLPVKPGQNERMVLGNYVDVQVRKGLRYFAWTEGLSDSGSSNLFAVNRRLREPNDPLYGIPDVRLGRNLYFDTTLALKNGNTEQLMRWNGIRQGNFIIVRPTQLGGSYAVSPSSIRTPTPNMRTK